MIIVFGSINLDLVTKTPRLPIAGETLQGYEFFTAPGGKGANQAVAAARLGISTKLVGRLGDDDFGQQLSRSLQATGVDIEGIVVDGATSSGIAVILVDDAGENEIILIPGANEQLGETDVERLKNLLPEAGGERKKGWGAEERKSGGAEERRSGGAEEEERTDNVWIQSSRNPTQNFVHPEAAVLLMQLEIPLSAVLSAAWAARQAGVPVILDPAPVQELPLELYQSVDILTPNQVEASQLVGFPVEGQETAAQAAKVLQQRGVGTVIVKLGEQGAFCATESESFFVPAFPVQAVDTVAAGDAFNGALAVALTKGLSLRQAVVWGSAAGALAATQAGAQTSLPDLETFQRFLENDSSLPNLN
ncbi:MAG: ribokinase [Symploca sp. SIO1C2]|nr:ribokinase [Symploca sp. SIO1C2]